MIKLLISFIAILIALVLAGDYLLADAGYVLVKFHSIALETSLLVFTILLIVGVCLILAILKLAGRIFGLKGYWRRWQENRNRKLAQQKINQGVLSLLQEDWRSAKTTLESAAKHDEYALVSLLALADAGQRAGDLKTRDESFEQLEKQMGPEGQLGLGLARADHYQAAKQWAEAQNILEKLQKTHPKHPGTLRRLLAVYHAQHAWHSLEGLLATAKKIKAVDAQMLSLYEAESFVGRFVAEIEAAKHRASMARANPKEEPAKAQVLEIEEALSVSLINQWNQAPNSQKSNTEYTLNIIDALSAADFEETARVLLEKAIKQKLTPELIRRYGQLNCHKPERMIEFLEKGVGKTPQTAEYLFALGRLYARAGDITNAHPLLEKSLQQKQTRFAYRCLADIYDQLQQHERSSQCYRKALALS